MGAADEGEWYYEPQHIHEAKVAVVRKESIRDKLDEEGLTRDVLLQKGNRAIKEYSVAVESSVASRVMRSGGQTRGVGAERIP
jgi:hypothetical protein